MQYRCVNRKLYITVHPAKFGAKLSTKMSQLGKPIDVQHAA